MPNRLKQLWVRDFKDLVRDLDGALTTAFNHSASDCSDTETDSANLSMAAPEPMVEGMKRPPQTGKKSAQTTCTDLSTGEVLARAKSGDEAAQENLVRRHLESLLRIAHGRLPDSTRGEYETQDVVQDTFYRVFRNLRDIESRGPGSFLAYLTIVMNNIIRDARRRAANRPDLEPLNEDVISTEPLPDDIAALKEKLDAYHRVLMILPEKQQNVFRLRMELGMSYQQIADQLGIENPNTVRMQVVRGIARLAHQMATARGER